MGDAHFLPNPIQTSNPLNQYIFAKMSIPCSSISYCFLLFFKRVKSHCSFACDS